MTGLKLFTVVYQTCERARSLRQHAREGRRQAQAMKSRARKLLARVEELKYAPDGARAEIPAVEPVIQRVTLRESFEANRQELLAGLQQSLRDLETLRMTPPDDPAVRELTADIRKTIAQAARTPSTLNRRRRASRSFVGAPHHEY